MIAQAGNRRAARGRGWLPLLAFGIVLTIVLCVVAAIRADPDPDKGTSDFRDFWLTAEHFRATGEISSERGVHNYLPFFTIFMVPWSLLPLRVAAAAFTLLSMSLAGITVVLVEVLLNDGLGPRPRKATLAAIGLSGAYVVSCGVLGQVGLLVLFLVVACWFLVERGREWEAGIPLGLAAAIKLLPLVLIVFFVLKWRWRVSASAIAVGLVCGLGLPLATLGYSETVRQHREFDKRAVRGHSARATIHSEKPRKAKYSNNALPMVLRRLLSKTDGDPREDRPGVFVNPVHLPSGVIWWTYLILMAGILVGSMAAALRGPPQWPPEDTAGVSLIRGQFAVWCCVMLLATPLLWTHYLVLAYFSLAWVADRVERTSRAERRADRLGLLVLLVWLVGAVCLAWPAARAAGAQLWSVGCLWGFLVWRVNRSARVGSTV